MPRILKGKTERSWNAHRGATQLPISARRIIQQILRSKVRIGGESLFDKPFSKFG